MKKCHPGSRRHAMHMNTSPTHGPVPPINQHSARTDYTLALRSRAGFGGMLGRLGCELTSPPDPVRTKEVEKEENVQYIEGSEPTQHIFCRLGL